MTKYSLLEIHSASQKSEFVGCLTKNKFVGFYTLKPNKDSSKQKKKAPKIIAPWETHKLTNNLVQLLQQCIEQQTR